MITPAILILASGQLILTTSQRLARTLDRARKLSDSVLSSTTGADADTKKKITMVLLRKTARRAVILQHVLTILYTAISIFVLSSVSIGFLEIFNLTLAWIPVVLGIAGIAFLFFATILLIIETRIARDSIMKEMQHISQEYPGNWEE